MVSLAPEFVKIASFLESCCHKTTNTLIQEHSRLTAVFTNILNNMPPALRGDCCNLNADWESIPSLMDDCKQLSLLKKRIALIACKCVMNAAKEPTVDAISANVRWASLLNHLKSNNRQAALEEVLSSSVPQEVLECLYSMHYYQMIEPQNPNYLQLTGDLEEDSARFLEDERARCHKLMAEDNLDDALDLAEIYYHKPSRENDLFNISRKYIHKALWSKALEAALFKQNGDRDELLKLIVAGFLSENQIHEAIEAAVQILSIPLRCSLMITIAQKQISQSDHEGVNELFHRLPNEAKWQKAFLSKLVLPEAQMKMLNAECA